MLSVQVVAGVLNIVLSVTGKVVTVNTAFWHCVCVCGIKQGDTSRHCAVFKMVMLDIALRLSDRVVTVKL